MKTITATLLSSLVFYQVSAQTVGEVKPDKAPNDPTLSVLQTQLDDLKKLYQSLKDAADKTQIQVDGGFASLTKKADELAKTTDTGFGKINSRTESLEKLANISNAEREKTISQNARRNQDIQDGFSRYIRFYGEKFSALDERLTSEELALELRKIINPESGSLGFKLSEKLNSTLKEKFNAMADEIMTNDAAKKSDVKKKIENSLNAVTSTLNNPLVNDIAGIIPFASTVKNIVGTVSGLVVNLFSDKELKDEFKGKALDKVKACQNVVLNELADIITFYDQMSKLDNQYGISLQNIRNDVGVLGIEAKEFCLGLENPLKKIDPAFTIEKEKPLRHITVQLSEKFDALKKDEVVNKNNLLVLTNISQEIKDRSSDLYNRYRAVQESKIIVNNKFVEQFTAVIKKSKIAANPDDISDKLNAKNAELISKMKENHALDKNDFEKYLTMMWL